MRRGCILQRERNLAEPPPQKRLPMNETLTQSQREDLSAWLDGELDAAEAARVEQLVADDPVWAREAEQLRRLDALLDAWEAPAPADDLAERTRQYASRPRSRAGLVIRFLAPLSAAAAVIIVVLGVYLGRETTRQASHQIPEQFYSQSLELFLPVEGDPDADLHEQIVIRLGGGSLAERLGQRPTSWDELTSEQRDQVKQKALAFLKMPPEEQRKILSVYDSTATNPNIDEPPHWMKVVVESFSPSEQQRMLGMTPAERAETYLRRKAELIDKGKLSPRN